MISFYIQLHAHEGIWDGAPDTSRQQTNNNPPKGSDDSEKQTKSKQKACHPACGRTDQIKTKPQHIRNMLQTHRNNQMLFQPSTKTMLAYNMSQNKCLLIPRRLKRKVGCLKVTRCFES